MRAFAVVIAILLLWAVPVLAEDAPPGITTTGTATVYVTPDRATVSISVTTTRKDIAEARAKNQEKAQKVVDALKAAGIAAADIGTERMGVGDHIDEQSHQPDGYTASQGYAVTIKDLSILDKVVDAIVASGGGTVPYVSLECSDMRKYRDQARNLAINAAKEKAAALAGALGSTIGKPRIIVEEPRMTGGYGGFGFSNSNSMTEAANPVPDTPATLPLGKIEVEATVEVTFELK